MMSETVTRSSSRLVAAFLLCAAVVFSGQMLAGGQILPTSARCHNHGQPARRPASHQCCAVGHSPSVIEPFSSAPDLHDVASQAVTEPQATDRPCERMFLPSLPASSSPPLLSPLRV
jgi:hypothetical protein